MVATLAARGREANLLDLRLVRLAQWTSETSQDDGEMCAVVLAGEVDVTDDSSAFGTATRSGDVFESLGDVVYVAPAQTLELRADSDDSIVAVSAASKRTSRNRPTPSTRSRPV
jgi:5-deoxy-D-glucuronate isomerase